MTVHGIDFTSAPSASKPIWDAVCTFFEDFVMVIQLVPLYNFRSFEALLAQDGDWTAAIDFPFGQPRQLIEDLGWPREWSQYVRHVRSLGKPRYEYVLRQYQAQQPAGEKRHLRIVDRRARSRSPMQLDFVPVAKMFFEGAPRLLESGCTVYPFLERDSAPTIVEGYPALVARYCIGRQKYKSDDPKAWNALRQARLVITQTIAGASIRERYRYSVAMPEVIMEECVEDGTGDKLDAVLCALQAAWASTKYDHGVPADCDMLEGWIVDPTLY